jgi:hypothetical protein
MHTTVGVGCKNNCVQLVPHDYFKKKSASQILNYMARNQEKPHLEDFTIS